MNEQASGYKGYTVKHAKNSTIVTTNIVHVSTGRTIRNAGKTHKLVHTRRIPAAQQEPGIMINKREHWLPLRLQKMILIDGTKKGKIEGVVLHICKTRNHDGTRRYDGRTEVRW